MLERLESDKEALEILEKLMKIYTATYNLPHLDFIKSNQDISLAERDKQLRAYGADETLALLFGMLAGRNWNQRRSQPAASAARLLRSG